jgi:hypothetical protein
MPRGSPLPPLGTLPPPLRGCRMSRGHIAGLHPCNGNCHQRRPSIDHKCPKYFVCLVALGFRDCFSISLCCWVHTRKFCAASSNASCASIAACSRSFSVGMSRLLSRRASSAGFLLLIWWGRRSSRRGSNPLDSLIIQRINGSLSINGGAAWDKIRTPVKVTPYPPDHPTSAPQKIHRRMTGNRSNPTEAQPAHLSCVRHSIEKLRGGSVRTNRRSRSVPSRSSSRRSPIT